MIFNSVLRQHTSTILVLAVFSVVIILFSGYLSMNILDGNGTFHQSDLFSCLFTTCVATFTVIMLLALFLFTAVVFDTLPSPGSEPLFLQEKPPRR